MSNVRDRWLQQVWTTHTVADSVRVVLLRLGQHMDAKGYVSVPRSTLAKQLDVSPRRITERIQRAKDAGLLDVVTPGRPGTTAVYAAKIRTDGWCARPHHEHGAVSSTPDGAPVRTTWTGLHGADGGPASSKGLASVSEHLAVHNNRERRDHHDVTRALGEHDESQSRVEVKNSTSPVRVAAAVLDSPPTLAPANVNRRPTVLGTAVEPAPYESVARAHPMCRWCEGDVSPSSGRCVLCLNRPYPVAVPA